MNRFVHRTLALVGWLGFLAVFAWTALFLTGLGVGRTVDAPVRTGTARAVAVDLGLLLLFAVQHSVMARRSVKAWLGRRVPAPLERTTYVLAADLCVLALVAGWQPFGGDVWHVTGPVAVVLLAVGAAGWLLAVAATFAVDHLALFGLRQAGWGRPPAAAEEEEGLRTGGLYAVVRHPLMTGLLLAFWATPRMGASHLFFAAASTGYVLLGVALEERDLRRSFGPAYDRYAARVPALLPRPWPAGAGLTRTTGRQSRAPLP